LSEICAAFEPGHWKDFSKEHRALREEVEFSLSDYLAGKVPDAIAVWGAFGAGKTEFLFWVAEKSLELGLIPIYFHLNDLLDDLPEKASPDDFRDHVREFVARVIEALRNDPDNPLLLRTYRDKALLSFILQRLDQIDRKNSLRPVLLIDEVEQAYISLADRVRADERSPMRAWLEPTDPTFKVFAFAVGSLYVLGKADRERLRVRPVPAVRPSYAKQILCKLPEFALPESSVNALWWLSRGKPRHLMKAAQRLRTFKPEGAIEVTEFVKELDSVSQAPYETDSQNVVPAAYVDHFVQPDELSRLLSIEPLVGQGDGRLFRMSTDLENELLAVIRKAFKMEGVATDLVRYIILLLDAVSVDGYFALCESDMPHLLRLAVDFLLEYERERLEKETLEGGVHLKKLLEVHDAAEQHSSQVFWKLQGELKANDTATPSLSFAAMAAAFPLPTTSPTLIGTNPRAVRGRYEDSKQPVFSWRDSAGNAVVFLTSTAVLLDYSRSSEFRQFALAPTTGVVALLPYDADDLPQSGFLEWLMQHDRLNVLHLPLALTDFLLSLRDSTKDGSDPFPIAEQAESDKNLQRQVSFYRSRLKAFVADSARTPRLVIPSDIPKPFSQILTRIADKDVVALATRQAFETISPKASGFLVDLRELVVKSKSLWGRSGYVTLAEELLPHRSPRNERPEAAKIIKDVGIVFSAYTDALRRLTTFVTQDEIECLADDSACKVALRSLWQTKSGGAEAVGDDLRQFSAQLNEIVQTLKTARKTEKALQDYGVPVSLGTVGTLLEVLPLIEKVAKDTSAILATADGADRRLAAVLFEQFLDTFIQAVASDVAKAKTTLSKVRSHLESLKDSKERIMQSMRSDSAHFAGLEDEGIQQLMDNLSGESVEMLTQDSSLDNIVSQLDDVVQDFASIEDSIARLDTAYTEIKNLVLEQPQWT
jgi:hypothetical protein